MVITGPSGPVSCALTMDNRDAMGRILISGNSTTAGPRGLWSAAQSPAGGESVYTPEVDTGANAV